MSAIKEITGMSFGRLQVLERLDKPNERGELPAPDMYSRYRCRCACGSALTASYYAVSGGKRSCGCDRIPERNDLTGWRFGGLTVISPVLEENGRVVRGDDPFLRWNCRCDCGRQVRIYGLVLVSGAVKSCGCVTPEKADLAASDVMAGCSILAVGKRRDRVRVRARFGGFEYELGTYGTRERAEGVRERARLVITAFTGVRLQPQAV